LNIQLIKNKKMNIDFEKPDSISQLLWLQKLLQIKKPTRDDIAMALLLAIRIFYENRPGKLDKKTDYFIAGTGCHNPYSYRDGKSLMGVLRLELEMSHAHDFHFDLSYEIVQNGFLVANIFSRGFHFTVVADIAFDKKTQMLTPTSVIITGGYSDCLMEELNNWLQEPISQLIALNDSESESDGIIVLPNFDKGSHQESYNVTDCEKAFVLEVRKRLPKRYGGYFSPVPKLEDLKFRDEIFQRIERAKWACREKPQIFKNFAQKILDPFMRHLKRRIPPHLVERVNKHFVFTDADTYSDLEYDKYNLQELFLEDMNKCFGVVPLGKLNFSNDEVNELNNAWIPFMGINPEFRYFYVYTPKWVEKRHEEFIEKIFESARRVQRGE
jgi:hypothetical protein